MTDAFFGELYLRSTRPFLSLEQTLAEQRFLLGRLPRSGRVLDLACGHGRHLAATHAFGVDFDHGSLKEARAHGPVARGDLRHLPYRVASFDAVYCWYNSLGTFEDDQVPLILAEVARVTRPGGLLIVQASHPSRAKAQPEASYDGPIGEGDHLREWAHYDAGRQRDELRRELTLADGRMLEANFFIRYYELHEWSALVGAAGFDLSFSFGSIDGAAVEDTSMDVIIGATRRG
jgi:SAM-dependent methyltransferase